MPRWLKWILIVAALLLTGAAAFYAGGVVGFAEGFASQMGLAAPSEAIRTVGILEALHGGRTASAINPMKIKTPPGGSGIAITARLSKNASPMPAFVA